MSKYIRHTPTITVYDYTGEGTTVSEDMAVQVARAIVALDNAERKFARLIDTVQYGYDIG